MLFSKRKKFLLVSLFLAWGFLLVLFTPFAYRYFAIIALAVTAYPLSAWSLIEDLDGIEWFFNLILPVLFLPSLALFTFLLPASNWFKMGIFLLSVLGQYGILLTSNIFSVAVIRTIQLLRAAQAIGFLFTMLIAFFVFNTIFSFRLMPYFSSILVILTTFLLAVQYLWTVKLDKANIKEIWISSIWVSLVVGELAFLISFWPVNILMASLFVVSALYLILSLLYLKFSERFFQKTINEYIRIGAIILILTFLVAKWG